RLDLFEPRIVFRHALIVTANARFAPANGGFAKTHAKAHFRGFSRWPRACNSGLHEKEHRSWGLRSLRSRVRGHGLRCEARTERTSDRRLSDRPRADRVLGQRHDVP